MASIAGDSNISQPDLGSTKSSHKNNVQNPAKRLKHDHLDNVLQKYLKLRNYNYKVDNGKIVIPDDACSENSSKESTSVSKLVANNNSIVFSYVNIDAHMLDVVDQEFFRLQQFIHNFKNPTIKEELHSIIPVMLCHLYLEILKGVDKTTALAFLEKHSPTFLQSEPTTEGHYELLSQLRSIVTVQDIANQPLLNLFRSSKHISNISPETSTVLRKYLSKHGHSIIIHILNKWFHYDIKPAEMKKCDDINIGYIEHDGHSKHSIQDSLDSSNSDDFSELVMNLKKIKLTRITNLLNADGVTCAVSDNETLAKAVGLKNSEIVLVRNNLDFIELEQNSQDERLEVQHLQGHGNSVTDLKFTQKGKLLLSCSQDDTARLWSMNDGKILNIYTGHQYSIWSLDVAPNEQYFTTGSFDRTARLWSLERQHPIRVFVGHSQSVQCVSFHKNGKYIATGSQDTTVRLFSITDAGVLRLMHEPSAPIYAIAFSTDGKMLAGAGEEGIIYIWDLAKGSCLYKLTGHTGPINSITWSNDLSFHKLYSGSTHGEVKMWTKQNEIWDSHDLYIEGSYKRIVNVELISSQSGPHIFAIPFNLSQY